MFIEKILSEQDAVVTILNKNVHNLPFVISIPHSGLYITSQMNNLLRKDVVLANMDWYLPELFSFLEKLGFTVIINNVSRYVIDSNRDCQENNLDRYTDSLVYTQNTFGKQMFKTSITQEEINERINRYYRVYHTELSNAILEKQKYFDKVYLIDLHSFGKQIDADIVLGNDNGKTMDEKLFHYIRELFNENGFAVQLNSPYKGGYITKHYGNQNKQCESLQIEISYYSYIDEREFSEEELPPIDNKVLKKCQYKLEKTFIELSKIVK